MKNKKGKNKNQKQTIETNQNNESELAPVEIAKINEEKKGFGGLIVFFALLIGFALILPYTENIKEYIFGTDANNNGNNKPGGSNNNNNNNNGDNEEVVYYTLDKTFKYQNLQFSNFKLNYVNDYTIGFSVITTIDANIALNSKNYFIELFTDNNTLLERIKLDSTTTVTKNNLSNLEFPITGNSYNNAKLIRVVEKSVTDYPEISKLNINLNGDDILTCTDNNRKFIYVFSETGLKSIEDSKTYNRGTDVDAYANLLTTKRSEVASLNNQEGVSSSLVETNDGFVINTITDVTTAESISVNKKYYFIKNTLAKVIKFEMEAMRYTCK